MGDKEAKLIKKAEKIKIKKEIKEGKILKKKEKIIKFKAFFVKCYEECKIRYKKDIRIKIIIIFLICLFSSSIVYSVINNYEREGSKWAYIDYQNGIQDIINTSENLARDLNRFDKDKEYEENKDLTLLEYLNIRIEENYGYRKYKVILANSKGEIIYKSDNIYEEKIDLNSLTEMIQNSKLIKSNLSSRNYDNNKEITMCDTFKDEGEKYYVFVRAVPEGHVKYYYTDEDSFIGFIISCGLFLIIFYYLTKKKINYVLSISDGVGKIGKGDLGYNIDIHGEDQLSDLVKTINDMSNKLKESNDKEKKMERIKTELITNVSHDLRTPLTSIIGYLTLLKDQVISKEDSGKYIDITYNKAQKLNDLIEQLFEYTKLTGEQTVIHKEDTNITQMLKQLIDEFMPLIEEYQLKINFEVPDKEIIYPVDASNIIRVFDNILMNAVRYANLDTEIIIKVIKDEKLTISITNECETLTKQQVSKLFDRFYRTDESRSEANGGSGLGLAISKSIVDLHGGKIWVQSNDGFVKIIVEI